MQNSNYIDIWKLKLDGSGKHVFLLPPLALPSLKSGLPLEELSQIPAVALFVERAQASNSSFELDEQNAADDQHGRAHRGQQPFATRVPRGNGGEPRHGKRLPGGISSIEEKA